MAHQTDHQQAYAYADFSSGHGSFENNHGLFELQAGMEMLGMPSEHFYPKPEGSSSGSGSAAAAGPLISPDTAMNSSWQLQQPNNHLLVDDPSSLRCLFPGQGSNDVEQGTPNRGLSLSLTYPAESSELQQNFHQNIINNPHQQHPQQIDAARFYQTFQLKSSMYLIPAQELLNEFCNLGGGSSPRHQKSRINKEGESSSSPSNWNQSALFSMDILELQQRQARLLSMLEEVR